MDSRFLYCFLDEGGNLDFSSSGTRFFTLTCVSLERPFVVQSQLADLKLDLIQEGLDVERFHATDDRQAVRDRVFAVLREHLARLRVDSLIAEKARARPGLRAAEEFYARLLGYLLRYVVRRCQPAQYSAILIFTDALPLKKKRRAFEKAIRETAATMLPGGVHYRVMRHSSTSNFGLQVADYCNWAVYRKWVQGDVRSYDMIQPAIRSEFDIFRSRPSGRDQ